MLSTISSVVGFSLSVLTLIGVFIAIGQFKGTTNQRLTDSEDHIKEVNKDIAELEDKVEKEVSCLEREMKKEIGDIRKDLASNAQNMQSFQKEFAEFSGEMRTTMNFIKEDLRDIKKDMKEKVNAKEK